LRCNDGDGSTRPPLPAAPSAPKAVMVAGHGLDANSC
jgi:hypothetical protein